MLLFGPRHARNPNFWKFSEFYAIFPARYDHSPIEKQISPIMKKVLKEEMVVTQPVNCLPPSVVTSVKELAFMRTRTIEGL